MNVFTKRLVTNQGRRNLLWRTYHASQQPRHYAAFCTWSYNKTNQLFLLQAETSITPPSLGYRSSVDFDLSNQSYYLLLALGPVDSSTGNIGYHSGGQLIFFLMYSNVFH